MVGVSSLRVGRMERFVGLRVFMQSSLGVMGTQLEYQNFCEL